jgi:hypothetical protein
MREAVALLLELDPALSISAWIARGRAGSCRRGDRMTRLLSKPEGLPFPRFAGLSEHQL